MPDHLMFPLGSRMSPISSVFNSVLGSMQSTREAVYGEQYSFPFAASAMPDHLCECHPDTRMPPRQSLKSSPIRCKSPTRTVAAAAALAAAIAEGEGGGEGVEGGEGGEGGSGVDLV